MEPAVLGEAKLESDRRLIRSVIHRVKEELADIAAHRERTRSRRAEWSLASRVGGLYQPASLPC